MIVSPDVTPGRDFEFKFIVTGPSASVHVIVKGCPGVMPLNAAFVNFTIVEGGGDIGQTSQAHLSHLGMSCNFEAS